MPTDLSLLSKVGQAWLCVTRPFFGKPPVSHEPSTATRDPEARPERPVPDTWSSGRSGSTLPQPALDKTYGPAQAAEGWRCAYDELRRRDEKMVKGWQEEVDTLLVFAGLFSAVLTAFVAQSYQSLGPNCAQTTVDVLLQISLQLANASTPHAVQSITCISHAASSDIRVNMCWFISLVLSLSVALSGFVMKQWLKVYIAWVEVSPYQNAVGLRQFRYESMLRWRLPNMFASLPVLLQGALVLFLTGLMDFLLSLHLIVGIVVSLVIAIFLALLTAAACLPTVASTCPFRSPLSELLVHVQVSFMLLVTRLRRRMPWRKGRGVLCKWFGHYQAWRFGWCDLDKCMMDRNEAAKHPAVGSRSIHHLWLVSQDEMLLERIMPCVFQGEGRHSLSRCWPIVTVLGGFCGYGGRVRRASECFARAKTMSTALNRTLAKMLLDAISSYDGAVVEARQVDLVKDAAILLPSLIVLTNDGNLIARYIASLQRIVRYFFDATGRCTDLTKADASHIFIDQIVTGIQLVLENARNINWKCTDAELEEFVTCAAHLVSHVAAIGRSGMSGNGTPQTLSVAAPPVLDTSHGVWLASDLCIYLAQLAIPIAVSCGADSKESGCGPALSTLLSVVAQRSAFELGPVSRSRHASIARSDCLVSLQHPLHILMQRNRYMLPSLLFSNLSGSLGLPASPDGPTTAEWTLLHSRLVASCEDANCEERGAQGSRSSDATDAREGSNATTLPSQETIPLSSPHATKLHLRPPFSGICLEGRRTALVRSAIPFGLSTIASSPFVGGGGGVLLSAVERQPNVPSLR